MSQFDPAADALTYPLSQLQVSSPDVSDLQVTSKCLGKGSNNKAFSSTYSGRREKLVLRVPRRRSDTQQRGSALWEFRQTLRASQLGVAPQLLDGFYARHASGEWTSGLYLLMERYECDLEEAISDDADLRARMLEGSFVTDVGAQVTDHLKALADDLMFVYDLKPTNLVLRFDENSVDVRIVDYGRDFCEWRGDHADDEDARTPVLDGLRLLLLKRGTPEGEMDALMKHILFAAMLVQLSATTTYNLYEDRDKHRMGSEQRRSINPFSRLADSLLGTMQGCNLSALRWLLRTDEVRGVLRHYHGRRVSGTERTLMLARGIEVS